MISYAICLISLITTVINLRNLDSVTNRFSENCTSPISRALRTNDPNTGEAQLNRAIEFLERQGTITNAGASPIEFQAVLDWKQTLYEARREFIAAQHTSDTHQQRTILIRAHQLLDQPTPESTATYPYIGAKERSLWQFLILFALALVSAFYPIYLSNEIR